MADSAFSSIGIGMNDVTSLNTVINAPKNNVSEEEANQNMVPPVLDGARLAGLRPVRAVTQEEIENFQRDGVVKLEGILPKEAIDFLRDCFSDIFENSSDLKRGGGARQSTNHDEIADEVAKDGKSGNLLLEKGGVEWSKRTGQMVTEANCFRWHTDFQRFCALSPLPEVVAQLLQSTRLKFHNDHLFFKEAGSLLRTGFHQDSSFFHFQGDQVAICWVPCDVVTRDSGAMGYLKGSHKGPTFARFNLISDQQSLKEEMTGLGAQLQPEIEGNEKDFDIIYHPARPGDVVIHHVNTIHGSAGNTSTERHRRAASIRYIGDDVTFNAGNLDPKFASSYNPTFQDGKILKARANWSRTPDGTPLEGGLYPVVFGPKEPPPPAAAKL